MWWVLVLLCQLADGYDNSSFEKLCTPHIDCSGAQLSTVSYPGDGLDDQSDYNMRCNYTWQCSRFLFCKKGFCKCLPGMVYSKDLSKCEPPRSSRRSLPLIIIIFLIFFIGFLAVTIYAGRKSPTSSTPISRTSSQPRLVYESDGVAPSSWTSHLSVERLRRIYSLSDQPSSQPNSRTESRSDTTSSRSDSTSSRPDWPFLRTQAIFTISSQDDLPPSYDSVQEAVTNQPSTPPPNYSELWALPRHPRQN